MTDKLSEALQNVEMTYKEVVEIANSMVNPIFAPVNKVIESLSENVHNLPITALRDFMLDLQLKAGSLAEVKDKAAVKAEVAEIIQKQKFAEVFNGTDGSMATKDKVAQIAIAQELISETVYNLVSSLFKTKVDQAQRLVAVLNTILMSRMQEAKFMNIGSSSEIGATARGDVKLNNGDF